MNYNIGAPMLLHPSRMLPLAEAAQGVVQFKYSIVDIMDINVYTYLTTGLGGSARPLLCRQAAFCNRRRRRHRLPASRRATVSGEWGHPAPSSVTGAAPPSRRGHRQPPRGHPPKVRALRASFAPTPDQLPGAPSYMGRVAKKHTGAPQRAGVVPSP